MQNRTNPFPTSRVLIDGLWHTVDDVWIAARLRRGLTARDREAIALAQYSGPLTIVGRLPLLALERTEVML